MHINFKKARLVSIFTTFTFLSALLFARLLYIQIIRNKFFTDLADRQHRAFIELTPVRGTIYDRIKRTLAIHLEVSSLYAVPGEIKEKEKTAGILAKELHLDKGALREKLVKNKRFVWLKRKLDMAEEKKVSELSIKGVYLANEGKRFYPGGRLSCHLLGVTGMDNTGLEGVEFYYDKELTGEAGWRNSYRDGKRREIASADPNELPARNGINLVLTIDEVIQHIIEKEIENIVKSYRPKAVSIVAMTPGTGEILGMANYPWFDPNDISRVNLSHMRNKAISDSFEPGSVFKLVTASAALEEGAVDFDSLFFCENGAYRIGNRTLHDHKPFGMMNFREIIEKSSNIGVFKVADKLGKKKLHTYMKRFNFGERTGIDLPGEAPGIMRDISNWSHADMTTMPIGHGIAVTPLQLATLVSVIANDGVMMRPYVVKSVLSAEGASIDENTPEAIRRVVSVDTARKVKELMEGVVLRGTGKNAQIENFRICGKTGTAEKVNPRGGYYKDKYIASFVGFAPHDTPAVALVVSVDEPRGEHFGSRVAAPAFKNIMEKTLSYMEIESDRSETKRTS